VAPPEGAAATDYPRIGRLREAIYENKSGVDNANTESNTVYTEAYVCIKQSYAHEIWRWSRLYRRTVADGASVDLQSSRLINMPHDTTTSSLIYRRQMMKTTLNLQFAMKYYKYKNIIATRYNYTTNLDHRPAGLLI